MSKKILFIIGSMQAGGAERVASRLCSNWASSEGLDVTLATGDEIVNDFYKVDPRVSRVSLSFNYAAVSVIKRVVEQIHRFFSIRSLLKQVEPDIIILSATEISLRVLFNLLFCRSPIIVCEHNNYYAVKSKFKRICRLLLYRKATHLLLLAERDIESYTSRYFPRHKILVMPNPLGIENNSFEYESSSFQLLAVGRLCEQKAFYRLVEIFKKINSKYTLNIIGEGPERENIQKLITKLGLSDRVKLVGHVTNMDRYYKESSLLLMTSIYEGLPMVIGEANAFGLPVIAFDCPTGPAEMIVNGKNGYLINDGDTEGFYKCVNEVVENSSLLKYMSQAAFEASKKYSIKNISLKWSNLIYSDE